MDPAAQAVLQNKYFELKQELASSPVIFNNPGEQIKQTYHIGHRIDGGKRSVFAQVRAATHRQLQCRRSVKTYSLEDAILLGDLSDIAFQKHPGMLFSSIVTEITTLSRLRHINFVRLYEVYLESKYIHLVMEMCRGRELYDFVSQERKITEIKSLSIISQILDALSYMHNMKMAHRALCIENVMFADKDHTIIKIIGLSSSGRITHEPFVERYGSPFYMAPEIFSGSYTEKCDIWSVGVILYTMLIGFQPIQGDNHQDLVKNIQKGEFLKSKTYKELSSPVKKLVKSMMHKVDRPSAAELLEKEIFQASFLQDHRSLYQYLLRIALSEDEPEIQNQVTLATKLKYAACKVLSINNKFYEIPHIERLWQDLDSHRSGSIGVKDLENSLVRCVGEGMDTENRAQLIFGKIDIFKTGTVTKDEFTYFTHTLTDPHLSLLAFRLLDPNQTGLISAENLVQMFSRTRIEESERLIYQALKKETVDLEDFISLINKFAN